MPAQYEAMRDDFIRQGLKERAAKKKAARIFNARRPAGSPPVGPHMKEPGMKMMPMHGGK